MGPNGPRRIFVPTNPDLADILGRTDLDFENFYFLDFLDPKFLDFQVPRVPDFQKSGLGQAWRELGRTWVREHPAAPRQPRRTNLRRSKELGQDRENPISARPVWGKIWKSGNLKIQDLETWNPTTSKTENDPNENPHCAWGLHFSTCSVVRTKPFLILLGASSGNLFNRLNKCKCHCCIADFLGCSIGSHCLVWGLRWYHSKVENSQNY